MDQTAAPETAGTTTVSALFAAWCDHRDEHARAALIERHLPLARKLAGRYAKDPEQLEDLVQVASVGLIGAVERFDPGRGNAFSSFAVPTIVGELKRHFRDTGWTIRVDRRAQERAGAVAAAQQVLSASGREATVGALAQQLDCDEAEVVDGLQASFARRPVSLDAPPAMPQAGSEPDAPSLLDTVGIDDAGLERVDDRATLSAAFRHLPRIERRIVYLRFGQDLSQREIASTVGISQMHVSRLLRRALSRLRELLEETPVTA